MNKWPHVPECFGWLGLDARGDWYMRDDAAQARGPFPLIKGSRVEHTALKEFISRNYQCDARGCWFFQNGPQKVLVELAAAPWVWRVHVDQRAWTLTSHTDLPATLETVWLDELGRVFIGTDLGLGLVHTQDVWMAADAVAAGHWEPLEIRFTDLCQRYGYVLSPQAFCQRE